VYYVSGYRAGIGTASVGAGFDVAEILAPRNLTNGEIMEALDAFYQEPLNRAIEVHSAIYIAGEKAKGVDTRKIEEDIASYRRLAMMENK
jgi:hypothetical protein